MQGLASLVPLLVLIVLMYFLMIRPQKKKDKQIQDMRRNLQVGDEIVTIGGICGKIVKTKDETIVIQVGADKVKFEMMRWSVSTVTNASQRVKEDVEAEEEQKKVKPKRLKKSADVDEEPKSDETTAEEIRAEEEKAEK
ncbi:MAG: preprotein translocase subunit YajC [Anaerovoracaceae bacterium]